MKLKRRVQIASYNKEIGIATKDDLTILKLYKKVNKINQLAGVTVMKEFEDGWYKGWVMDSDKNGFLVEYEDGDSEHMTAEEVYANMYTPSDDPMSLCDRIEELEDSGCKAQTFSKLCKEIVDGRPHLARKLANLYGNENIKLDPDDDEEEFMLYDIGPHLWTPLGDTEVEKLYMAKRILEQLYYK